jgi:hypothetical protein
MDNLNQYNLPQLPEIFLDKSYCHVDHNQKLTWWPKGEIVYERGRGKMFVIFGAIAIFRNANERALRGEIVKNSLYIWDLAIRSDGSTANSRRRSRPRLHEEDWATVPESVLRSEIASDQVDYHKHFMADIIENLFKKLCQTL